MVDLRNTLVSRLLFSRSLKVFRRPKPHQHMVEALSEALNIHPIAAPRLWLDLALELEQAGDEVPRDRRRCWPWRPPPTGLARPGVPSGSPPWRWL